MLDDRCGDDMGPGFQPLEDLAGCICIVERDRRDATVGHHLGERGEIVHEIASEVDPFEQEQRGTSDEEARDARHEDDKRNLALDREVAGEPHGS